MKKVLSLVLVLGVLLSVLMVMPAAAQDEVVKVGINAEFPPFESVDADGEIVGFDVDLMNAIAADAGFEVEYINTKWDGIFVALAEGEFDLVISAATITEEREEIINFSDPYFNAGQNITVSADLAESVAGPEDLAGLRVGVQLGTTGDTYASEELDGVEVVRFDEASLAFQALGAGEVDAVIVDAPVSIDILANNPDIGGVIVGEPLTDEFYGIAVNPENADLLDMVNNSLANVIASGEYAEIYTEWFQIDPPADFMGGEEAAADAGGMTLADVAAGNEDLTTLGTALNLADDKSIAEALAGTDAITVFAPSNDAFTSTLTRLQLSVVDVAGRPDLVSVILRSHVVVGTLTAADLAEMDGQELETVEGEMLLVEVDGDTIMVGGATVVTPDLAGSNGVIHVIDNVIVPQSVIDALAAQ